jgi:hypothetical protein
LFWSAALFLVQDLICLFSELYKISRQFYRRQIKGKYRKCLLKETPDSPDNKGFYPGS